MKIEATDLRDAIADGIKLRGYNALLMLGNRGEIPKPEYLTTAAICLSLGDKCRGQNIKLPQMIIRAEEQTSMIWKKKRFLAKKNSLPIVPESEFVRNGRVDISLLRCDGLESTFGVIENKGLSTFTKDNQLTVNSRTEIDKDIKRNADFHNIFSADESIQYTAFTFYLEDTNSKLNTEGKKYCTQMHKYFEDYLTQLNLPSNFYKNVLIDTWDSHLYESEAHALRVDCTCGPSAYEEDPPWHIAFGVISLYRTGDCIVDQKNLSSNPVP